MEWIRSHTLTALSLCAGILLIAGAFVLIERAPEAGGNPLAWGGQSSALQSPAAYTPNPVLTTLAQPTFTTQTPTFLPITPGQAVPGTGAPDESDLASLLAQLSGSQNPSESFYAAGTSSVSAYSLIPSGLIAIDDGSPKRTSRQQALYEYGNEVGGYIRSYESSHPNVPQVLKDQIEDRTNAAKGQAVKDIGAALIYIGTSMDRMEQVPDDVAGLHKALAGSYKEIGQKLQKVPDAEGDQAFIAAIQSYDASADAFTKNFIALADFFSLSQVKFSSQDAGSVFTFTAGGGF